MGPVTNVTNVKSGPNISYSSSENASWEESSTTKLRKVREMGMY